MIDAIATLREMADNLTAEREAVGRLVDALRTVWRRLPDGDPLRDVAFAALEPFGGVPPL